MTTSPANVYPSPYFALQLTYAEKIATLLGRPFDDVLLEYTSIYKILGIEGDFDAGQPSWQVALQLAHGTDAANGLYHFYLSRLDVIPQFTDEPHWGCFAYNYRPTYETHTHVVRLHFSNEDVSTYGALSRERMPARLAELAAMFTHIAAHEPQATTICGGSWLYHREAYRRLFPPAFTTSPIIDEPHYQYRALWGQFLRHDWTVNEETATRFLERVAGMSDEGQIASCFPYQVLLTACPISAFLDFYGLAPSVSRG